MKNWIAIIGIMIFSSFGSVFIIRFFFDDNFHSLAFFMSLFGLFIVLFDLFRNKKSYSFYLLWGLISANVLSVLLGIFYLLSDVSSGFWNIFGVLMLMTLVGNITVSLLRGKQKLIIFDYIYLFLTSTIMIVVPIMNTYASADIHNISSRSILSITLIFSLFILGTIVTIFKLHFIKNKQNFTKTLNGDQHTHRKNASALKKGITVILCLFLLIGIYFCYQLTLGKNSGFIEIMLFPQYSLFFSISILSMTGLILKMHALHNRSAFNIIVATIGVAISVILSIPLVSTPFAIHNAEPHYTEVFGEDWKTSLLAEDESYFFNTPFSLADYFFGNASNEYIVKQDIAYYHGTKGVDQGIKLYFDIYRPPNNRNQLPGGQSVLIRIHGGGWTIGDKGSSNNAQVNKHFASQGYVVFDVQYGLSNKEKMIEFAKVPDHVVGNFSIDDMVRHIGIFTNYLVEHNDEFGANLDSVFISGGSAGGQLANAVGLGIASGKYDEILNPNLNVKGIISVFPANGLANKLGIEGTTELSDPTLLVSKDSPPSLIYHGTHDGIVEQEISEKIVETYYENENFNSALILMPFAGHASNYYFSSYYNQIFTYYMERFMYQFK